MLLDNILIYLLGTCSRHATIQCQDLRQAARQTPHLVGTRSYCHAVNQLVQFCPLAKYMLHDFIGLVLKMCEYAVERYLKFAELNYCQGFINYYDGFD